MLKKLLKILGALLLLAVLFVAGFILLERHAPPVDAKSGP